MRLRDAANDVSNTADWAAVVLEKMYNLLSQIEENQCLDLEVTIPLGENIAKIFGKEHLTIRGETPILTAQIKIQLPKKTS